MKYAYSEELKAPFRFGNIDFEKKAVQWIMNIWALAEAKKARRFLPEKGVSKRSIDLRMADGEMISCYVIEPENNRNILPAVIYYHGGGFLFPIQEMMLRMAQEYVKHIPVRIFIPEYRLALKTPYPTPFQDCWDALLEIVEQANVLRIDPKQMILYGDSAGGCLAAAIALRCRDDKKIFPKAQMLIYPVLDSSMRHTSMDEYWDAVWSKSANRHMWNLYLKGVETADKYAVPFLEHDFSGMPPTYIEALEMDTLRDEALEYGERMKQSGIRVETNLIPGAFHGYDAQINSPLVQRSIAVRMNVMQGILSRSHPI